MSMSAPINPKASLPEKLDEPRLMAIGGLILFIFGLVILFVVWAREGNTTALSVTGAAALFLAMGYPLLMYSRALRFIAALEKRIKVLEGKGE
jgi:putative Ca2+/H+ antiporter (TMEM165/GDT1 family)